MKLSLYDRKMSQLGMLKFFLTVSLYLSRQLRLGLNLSGTEVEKVLEWLLDMILAGMQT